MQDRFEVRKRKILEQLGAPDEEYHDLSPKGSIDKPIRTLISDINGLCGLVTTSSCSGRISVFLEGRKSGNNAKESQDEIEESRAGPGGKGGGGAWLFISHDPIEVSSTPPMDYISKFGLIRPSDEIEKVPETSFRFIHLKFEPMILHILTASLDHSQRLLTAALSAGFRESGAVSLSAPKNGEPNPMVAIRSTGYSFDSIIGYQNASGQNVALVDEIYLHTLVNIANERFSINAERIARFRSSLLEHCNPSRKKDAKSEWEDPEVRRQRKREEGLARQRELQAQSMYAIGIISKNTELTE